MTNAQETFINKIAPHAIEAMKDHGILASLTIAQAILESSWGKASIGNNIFGIKANTAWKGKTKIVKTHEYIKGIKTAVDAMFRDYESIEDSIKDHTSLFVRLDRYKAIIGEKDYKLACVFVQKAGYATDPTYSEKLVSLIQTYKLNRFDKVTHNATVATSTINPAFAQSRKNLMKYGVTDGSNPKGNITREQAWSMIDRAIEHLTKELGSK